MKIVILCGGFGTRLREETESRPKPMVEVGGRPILWHIMRLYAAQGFNEFVLALGYKSEVIKHYFLNYHSLRNSFSIHLGSGRLQVYDGAREDWTVHLIDTGVETQTGGRIKRLAPWIGNESFMMTYGDGLADIDVKELVAFHQKHGKLATVTAVRPPARFGGLKLNGDWVATFAEKSQINEGWINGGFFVLEPRVMEYIEGDETIFEREPLERLGRDGELLAYRHSGFWQCMDTRRDAQLLEGLWSSGKAPWKVEEL
jgi:glucose-1-phosphate cytidylyltransferase